jgi:hypothetical protein
MLDVVMFFFETVYCFASCRDLLSAENANKLDVKMKSEGKGYHVPGLVTQTVSCLADVNRVRIVKQFSSNFFFNLFFSYIRYRVAWLHCALLSSGL